MCNIMTPYNVTPRVMFTLYYKYTLLYKKGVESDICILMNIK